MLVTGHRGGVGQWAERAAEKQAPEEVGARSGGRGGRRFMARGVLPRCGGLLVLSRISRMEMRGRYDPVENLLVGEPAEGCGGGGLRLICSSSTRSRHGKDTKREMTVESTKFLDYRQWNRAGQRGGQGPWNPFPAGVEPFPAGGDRVDRQGAGQCVRAVAASDPDPMLQSGVTSKAARDSCSAGDPESARDHGKSMAAALGGHAVGAGGRARFFKDGEEIVRRSRWKRRCAPGAGLIQLRRCVRLVYRGEGAPCRKTAIPDIRRFSPQLVKDSIEAMERVAFRVWGRR